MLLVFGLSLVLVSTLLVSEGSTARSIAGQGPCLTICVNYHDVNDIIAAAPLQLRQLICGLTEHQMSDATL